MAWLRSKLNNFGDNRSGSIAIVFVFAFIIMVMMVGIAVDYGRAERASADVVGSIDSAALAGAKAMVEEELNDADVTKLVDHYIFAQIGSGQLSGASYSNLKINIDRTEGTVQIDVDIHVPTTFSRIAQKDRIDFHKSAKTTYKLKNVELAMVLDTTGSMGDNNKIVEMQAAAAQAVDVLMPSGRPALNRIAIAPFSSAVFAGAYASDASNSVSSDCVVERSGPDAYTDVNPSSSPVGTAAVGAPGAGMCPAQTIMPLNKDPVALKALINGFAPGGGTAGHIGLAWGWYLISPNWNSLWPAASQPKPYGDPKAIKAILLMTDGMFNTAYFNDTSPVQAAALCDAIKAQGVKIFTVGFELALNASPDDVNARTLLSDCASTDGGGGKEFYDATNGSDLSDAFKKIAGKMMALRLSD